MVYIFKTYPFNMSFEEIRTMTFHQAVFLIKGLERDRNRRAKQFSEAVKKYGEKAFPIVDLTKGIYNG